MRRSRAGAVSGVNHEPRRRNMAFAIANMMLLGTLALGCFGKCSVLR
jgi:hypothetical protein